MFKTGYSPLTISKACWKNTPFKNLKEHVKNLVELQSVNGSFLANKLRSFINIKKNAIIDSLKQSQFPEPDVFLAVIIEELDFEVNSNIISNRVTYTLLH